MSRNNKVEEPKFSLQDEGIIEHFKNQYYSIINNPFVISTAKQISHLLGKAGTSLTRPCTRMNFGRNRNFVVNTIRLYRGENRSRNRNNFNNNFNNNTSVDVSEIGKRAFKRLKFVTHYYLLLSNSNYPSQPTLILHNVGSLELETFNRTVNPKHNMLRYLRTRPFRISTGLEPHAMKLCRERKMNSCWEAADKLYE